MSTAIDLAGNTTIGDSSNEVAVTLRTKNAVHHIRALNQVNPEILLVHQSKAFGFHLVTKSGEELLPVSRGVKAIFLRDQGRLA